MSEEEQKPKTMFDVPYKEDAIENLKQKPLLRDNLDNLKADFRIVYERFMNEELGPIPEEEASSMKTQLFVAFCHGAQIATRVDSTFRIGYKIPAEFDPTKQIMQQAEKKLVLP